MTNTHSDWFNLLADHRRTSEKSWLVTLILSITLGILGADRFYAARPILGLLKCFTFGGFLIWWPVDVILVAIGQMKDDEGLFIRRSRF